MSAANNIYYHILNETFQAWYREANCKLKKRKDNCSFESIVCCSKSQREIKFGGILSYRINIQNGHKFHTWKCVMI